jgi:hypothetical protein
MGEALRSSHDNDQDLSLIVRWQSGSPSLSATGVEELELPAHRCPRKDSITSRVHCVLERRKELWQASVEFLAVFSSYPRLVEPMSTLAKRRRVAEMRMHAERFAVVRLARYVLKVRDSPNVNPRESQSVDSPHAMKKDRTAVRANKRQAGSRSRTMMKSSGSLACHASLVGENNVPTDIDRVLHCVKLPNRRRGIRDWYNTIHCSSWRFNPVCVD